MQAKQTTGDCPNIERINSSLPREEMYCDWSRFHPAVNAPQTGFTYCYFGGIKLGAGGLVRAYSGAAQQTMETLPVITQVKLNAFTVTTDFAQEQFVRHWTESVKGKVTDCTYSQAVTLSIAIPDSAVEALRQYEGSLGLTVKAVKA